MKHRISRRGLLKAGAAAGIAIKISFLRSPAEARLIQTPPRPAPDWIGPDGQPKYRLDAIAKVTGSKTFSRDYRARDLDGWPSEQSHAFMIHATKADHTFEDVDLSLLGDLQPDRLIFHEDLVADGVASPDSEFYGDVFLVPKGETPRLLGQPVALLIYKDFDRFYVAKRMLRFNDKVVKYGAQTGPNHPPHYGASRYVRIGGETPEDEDVFSPLKDAAVYGKFSGDDVVWPDAGDGADDARAMAAAAKIQQMVENADDTLVLKRQCFSQSIDASAMEPDNGNVWYDRDNGVLHMMIATQSPYTIAEVTSQFVSKSKFALSSVDLNVGYTVGYGTKDHSIFPYFCAIAGLYGDGRPVRLANNRYEHFQTALKRHAFDMENTLVVDRKTGRFRALIAKSEANGGGRENFSVSVSTVGATSAQSIYYFPMSDLTAIALASRAVEAGSTRGYGTIQTMSATEVMVDEAAEMLGIDAIDLRLRNVFKAGMKNTQGAIPAGALRNEEILNKARAHPLWTGKADKKAAFETENPGKKYGVGFAQVQKDYGSGAEAAIASLEFDPQGRIKLTHVAHEMGPGATTSQAIMVGNILGRVPDETAYGIVNWPQMPLESNEQPYTTSQEDQDSSSQNPRWTPTVTSPMSASNSSYFMGHATREAARILLDRAIWPAAKSLWSQGIGGGSLAPLTVSKDDLHLKSGMISAGGMAPLPFDQVAAEAHRLGLITGTTVHTFNRWQWASAEFDIPNSETLNRPIDALAVKYGEGASDAQKALMTLDGWHFIERSSVSYPPVQRNNAGVTYYTPVATLVEIAVDIGSGQVEILTHHTITECGTQIVPDLVSGQIEGGLAMGIGHALKEYLPLYEDGPGNGTWNWNRYELPRARDVAVWSQSAEILPPFSDSDPPKGVAEVVMIAIVPALANAVNHAIGKRFHEFPITPFKIREALA